jgi:hypothetical protein
MVLGGLLLFVGGTVALAMLVAGGETKPNDTGIPLSQNTSPGTPTPGPNPAPNPGLNPAPNPGPNPNPNPGVNPNPNPGPNPNPNPMPPNPPNPVPPPNPMPAAGSRLPPELQAKVNAAIDKGVAFLRAQEQNGFFTGATGHYQNGSHFLIALTLLECGVPGNDPTMQRLASRVRDYARGPGGRTYELSLALLFLNRLNDPADKPLIRDLGLRLLPGQIGGGWGYDCTPLSAEAQTALGQALQKVRPQHPDELILRDDYGRLLDPSGPLLAEDRLDAKTIKNIDAGLERLRGVQGDLQRFQELQRMVCVRATEDPAFTNMPLQPGMVPNYRVRLPRNFFRMGAGDNSNTQFAALGLWAASRNDLPVERPLAVVSARFRLSQERSGAWRYGNGFDESETMTCAGLLGLAVGHGLRAEEGAQKREDPQIQAALNYLSARIKQNGDNLARNLYLVWSVERVGVLFNLEKIGDIDWYEWGAKHLVASQGQQGAWALGGYLGSSPLHDTCFALLFLKRANLVSDLTNKIEQVLDIKGMRR